MPKQWEFWLYPDLRTFAPSDQDAALKKAKDAEFDRIELAGIGLAIVLTVAFTRYSVAGLGLADRIGSGFANLVVAFALLLVLAGPFYVRRVRRGLAKQLRGRSKQPSDSI